MLVWGAEKEEDKGVKNLKSLKCPITPSGSDFLQPWRHRSRRKRKERERERERETDRQKRFFSYSAAVCVIYITYWSSQSSNKGYGAGSEVIWQGQSLKKCII